MDAGGGPWDKSTGVDMPTNQFPTMLSVLERVVSDEITNFTIGVVTMKCRISRGL
jgi:hypothetical protein